MPIYKIAHFSDSHAGYRYGQLRDPKTGINLREQDGYNAFDEAISQMLEIDNLNAVICSGDIFHSPNPTAYTIVQVQNQLKRLYQKKIPFYNIAGNHDATDNVRDVPSNGVLHFPELELYSYVKPYVKEEILPGVTCHFVSHHSFVEQKKTFKNVNPVEDKFNILVTHGSVYDSFFNGILHSESEPREVVISEELMSKDWDYTLLGHIHERGWVHSSNKISDTSGRKQFYGGSLIRRGFADKECRLGRGWTLWIIDTDKKTMEPEFYYVEQRFQKDLIVFCEKLTTDEIVNKIWEDLKKIDFSQHPIIRLTLIDLTRDKELGIPWKDIYDYTKDSLKFIKKIKTKEEFKEEIDNYSFSFDLLTAYKEFFNVFKIDIKDNVIQDNVKKTSQKLLEQGQERVMS